MWLSLFIEFWAERVGATKLGSCCGFSCFETTPVESCSSWDLNFATCYILTIFEITNKTPMNLAKNKIKYKTQMTTIVYNHMINSVFILYLPSTIL